MIAILASDVSALVDSTLFYSAFARSVNHENRNKKCPGRFCGDREDEGHRLGRKSSRHFAQTRAASSRIGLPSPRIGTGRPAKLLKATRSASTPRCRYTVARKS